MENMKSLENITGFLYIYRHIPYSIINEEAENPSEVKRKFEEIQKYYDIYNNGADFLVEGNRGDYISSYVKHKISARLINKEARFLFAETPDILITSQGVIAPNDTLKQHIDNTQVMLNNIFEKNFFDKQLLQSAKDCFIAGRVACMLNFNNDTGVTITFLKSTEFIAEYKLDNPNELQRFVSFQTVKYSKNLSDTRIFKKKYELQSKKGKDGSITNVCYAEDGVYDGMGNLIEETFSYQPTEFDRIPAAVFINDGLIGEEYGESEIKNLEKYESLYSKLANADVDAERKAMNSVTYTVDMDSNSTKNLSSAPGAYWDLTSDQNLDTSSPQIGILEPSMAYSSTLDTSLRRTKSSMYDQVDIPDISLESMTGVITSGKALKSVYWPLIVRCKEKMKTWGPKLKYIVSCIIDGATYYPDSVTQYTSESIVPFDYEVKIDINYPLPEDEQDEKSMDIQEVVQQTMSRKSYMVKWRGLTEEEANAELEQIALERQILEDSSMPTNMFEGL